MAEFWRGKLVAFLIFVAFFNGFMFDVSSGWSWLNLGLVVLFAFFGSKAYGIAALFLDRQTDKARR